jgi:hypothetical protein
VGLKGLKTDGTALGNAIIMADLLEASFADANPSLALLRAAGEKSSRTQRRW